MAGDLLMPKLGLTMSEGLLLEWKVAPGQAFATGDVLFVVETDKAATEIEAEADGRLAERLVGEGETVAVGTAVGKLAGGRSNGSTRIVATPLARRMARERGLDLSGIAGSGPRGRIKSADVEGATPPASASDAMLRVKPTPIQAAMARRLGEVKHGVPHFYLATEVEVSALTALRAQLNGDAEQPKLTLTHFVLAAVGRALASHPNINRTWADGDILEFAATDVAMAVETDRGLYVPVVRGVGSGSLDRVAASARDMVAKARAGRLAAADMQGAAIAVSNAGMHDVTWLTPIINPGHSSILGVGSVREILRPDASGAPALRREMGVVFSGDHRIHTGVEGLAFLNWVKAILENPAKLLARG